MDKGPLWEMERGEREREFVLYDRVRGMRKTQKAEPCVFPREAGREGTDEKSTGRINSKMNLVKG